MCIFEEILYLVSLVNRTEHVRYQGLANKQTIGRSPEPNTNANVQYLSTNMHTIRVWLYFSVVWFHSVIQVGLSEAGFVIFFLKQSFWSRKSTC